MINKTTKQEKNEKQSNETKQRTKNKKNNATGINVFTYVQYMELDGRLEVALECLISSNMNWIAKRRSMTKAEGEVPNPTHPFIVFTL